jgi:exonuclease VII small subunit
MGIFENLKNNYENVNFDLESIVSLLQSGELDELKSLVANLN